MCLCVGWDVGSDYGSLCALDSKSHDTMPHPLQETMSSTVLQASGPEEAELWMKCIEASIISDTVYDTFQERKKKITSVQGLELPRV